jgi:DHA3 family multidrug efflux protein-like MFS transporter
LIFIPFMTDGVGADTIGSWFGTGPDRGIALVFVLTGIIGLIVTALALRSRFYRQLSERYGSTPEPESDEVTTDAAQPVAIPDAR